MSTERIDALFHAFDPPKDDYCRAEVEEALTLREEITPRLIAVLDEVAADPKKFKDEHTLLHLYAASLLSHFQEPKAHLPIIKAFNLPSELEYGLWGEMTSEFLPVMLFQTCGGKVDALRELVVDKSANEMVRCAAMDALAMAALHGAVPREDVLALFGGLFTGTEADRTSTHFWSNLVSAATDLWPQEILPTLEKAFEDGLVFEDSMDWEDVEESVAGPKDEWLARERRRTDQLIPKDVHDYLSWLEAPPSLTLSPSSDESRLRREERERKKAKKKLAKKSKKKNRR